MGASCFLRALERGPPGWAVQPLWWAGRGVLREGALPSGLRNFGLPLLWKAGLAAASDTGALTLPAPRRGFLDERTEEGHMESVVEARSW